MGPVDGQTEEKKHAVFVSTEMETVLFFGFIIFLF